MDVTSAIVIPSARTIYTSATAEVTVTGANVRSSMLPNDVRTGTASFYVGGGVMPIGSTLLLVGAGIIGARLTTPPGFNLVPWFTPDGGSKTDLTGFAQAPLLGTDGTCEVWLAFSQLATGIRTSGYVRYGATNGMAYSIGINGGGTGSGGAAPVITASDPSVGRTFGVDGFWGSGADTREYVKCRGVNTFLMVAS